MLPSESYDIEAAFYRKARTGEERLGSDSRLRLNDEIHLSVQTSTATYLYVVNEDEKGEAFLLFPHPDVKLTNPVAANRQVRLPSDQNWEVDSVGGKEHFIVFASKGPVAALEEAFKNLPSPELKPGPRSERLPAETLDGLRGLGRLAPAAPRDKPQSHFRDVFTEPLGRTRNGHRPVGTATDTRKQRPMTVADVRRATRARVAHGRPLAARLPTFRKAVVRTASCVLPILKQRSGRWCSLSARS